MRSPDKYKGSLFSWNTVRKKILGNNSDGILYKVIIYFFLFSIGFIFLYPILGMLSYSLKTASDVINPLVDWVPTQIYFENYTKSFQALNYSKSIMTTLVLAGSTSLLQSLSCSLIGYGFARFRFPGKNLFFFLVIATFIIPPQITVIPQFLMFKSLGLLENIACFLIPAFFGQGLKNTIFILIFYQFFKMIPKVLDEASQVDGAGALKVFIFISIPMAVPAYIVSFLFSFVWYWNETFLTSIFLGGSVQTLPMKLMQFAAEYQRLFQGAPEMGRSLNEAIEMAGTVLNILPLLIIFFVAQRWFVEGVDRTGITGE